MRELYTMSLHETIKLDSGIEILRVPGYWIYTLPNGNSIKIEFDTEFEYSGQRTKLTSKEIINYVARYFDLNTGFLKFKSREGNMPRAKAILVNIFDDILKYNRSHTMKIMYYKTKPSVIGTIKAFKNWHDTDKSFKRDYENILNGLEIT